MAYIDTSVLVAYYCPEPLSERADRAIRKAGRPAISLLTGVEFRSALAIKVRTGGLDLEMARRLLMQFREHVDDRRYRIVPIEAREYGLACEWIGHFTTCLRTVDALHLAAAFSNGLRLLTADRDLAGSAKMLGVACQIIS